MNTKYLILVQFILLLFVSCSPKDKAKQNVEQKTLKIAYLPITHSLPLLIANELPDSLKKYKKLELVKFSSWTELQEALNTGKVDGASVLVQLALKSKEKGIGLKAVALGHHDGNVVVVSPEINSTNDLKGKIIAIPHRMSTHHILLQKLLKDAGLSIDDVKITELPPPEMPAALAEKRIVAYIVAEPFGAKSVASEKGKVLFQSNQLWEHSICCALVLRDSVIKNNRAEVQALLDDYQSAGKLLTANSKNYTNQIKKYIKVDDKVLDLSLRWISFDNLQIQEADYATLTQWLKDLKLIQNPPAYADFVDNSFLVKK